jgi:hypothetical protein
VINSVLNKLNPSLKVIIMTINSSHSLSLSHFNRYAGACLGLAVSAISLASVNNTKLMVNTLYSCSSQTLAIISSLAGALSQNPVAVIGVTAGGFSVLQTFSKPSEIAQNLAISAVTSTCLVALAKSSIDLIPLSICLMPVAMGLGIYKHHAYYNKIIADAERGNEEAIWKLLNSPDYLANTATATAKKRIGEVFLNFAEKLYAKGDQNEALLILAICFRGGLNTTKSENTAMLCMLRMDMKEAQASIVAHNADWWNEPIKHDPAAERLIDLYLGIKKDTTITSNSPA